MSEPDNDKSTSAAAAAAGDDKENDDRKKQKREGRVRKAKKSALFRFRKLKNQLQRKKRRVSNSNFGCLGKRSGGGCCLSLNLRKKSPNLDSSPVESQTSDPNNPEFTVDLLRGLIEKNDFYSSECNTHFDIDSDRRTTD